MSLVVVCCRLPGKSKLVKPTLRLSTCIHSKEKTKEHVGLMMNRVGGLVTQDTEKGYLKLPLPQTLLARSAFRCPRSLCQIALFWGRTVVLTVDRYSV